MRPKPCRRYFFQPLQNPPGSWMHLNVPAMCSWAPRVYFSSVYRLTTLPKAWSASKSKKSVSLTENAWVPPGQVAGRWAEKWFCGIHKPLSDIGMVLLDEYDPNPPAEVFLHTFRRRLTLHRPHLTDRAILGALSRLESILEPVCDAWSMYPKLNEKCM